MGESASRLSKELRIQNSQVHWSEIIGMRNIFAHNYMGINFNEVWKTVIEDIPILKVELENILNL